MATSIKYCLVPICRNNSKKNPQKYYLRMSDNPKIRKKWLEAINVDALTNKTKLYICEDHFDLERDAKNWNFFKTIGSRMLLKKNVVPHRNIHELEPNIPESQLSAAEKKIKTQNVTQFQVTEKVKKELNSEEHLLVPETPKEQNKNLKFEEIYIKEEPVQEVPNNLEMYHLRDPIQESPKICVVNTQPNNEFTNINTSQKINENNTETTFIKQECVLKLKEELEDRNS